ncbi:MAG TPA: PASTA domain-containing protein [Solirubrobacteraceae bacterium]|jgi:virginiamycin B lyase
MTRGSARLKGLALACAVASVPAPAAAEQVTRTPLAAGDTAQALEAGPDGRLWLTLGAGSAGSDRLLALGPGSASRVYAVKSGTAGGGLVTGGDGALWSGGEDGSNVSRTTTAGATSTVALPPHGLRRFTDAVRAGDGAVWFGGDAGLVRIGMDGAVERYELNDPLQPGEQRAPQQWPTPPLRLAAGADGNIWFVGDQDVVGRLVPGQGYSSFTIPHDETQPIEAAGIAAGPDGALWVAVRNERELVRVATDGSMTRVALRGPADGAIEADGGVLWVAMDHPSQPGRHYLARVQPGGAISYVEVGFEVIRLAGGAGVLVNGLQDEGRTVVRVLSDAARSCVVPRLRGLSLAQARRRLAAANCRLGRVRGRRRGRVRSQSPRAASVRPAGTKVRVRMR